MEEIIAILKDLKNQGVLVPIISSFNSPILFLQKSGRSWKITEYLNLHHLMAQIVAAM